MTLGAHRACSSALRPAALQAAVRADRMCTRAPLNLTRNSCAPSTVFCASIASTLSAMLGFRARRVDTGARFALLGRAPPASSESLSSMVEVELSLSSSPSSSSSPSLSCSLGLSASRARRGLQGLTARGHDDGQLFSQSASSRALGDGYDDVWLGEVLYRGV